MERSAVDFGIDLGTTNSCIAVLEGTKTRIIKTNERDEITPSAVSFDKKGRLHIGKIAKNQLIAEDEIAATNVFLEFKLAMGQPGPFRPSNENSKQMTPEELSAEILKRLKSDVYMDNLREEVTSAVISVPAVFELPQCSATDKAAKLAGLSFSPLIQEPVAAALAYGFQTTQGRGFWMVYDFGGGTFDAAIMQVRDEQIQVVNHGGDNHLGGGLIDLEIVNQLLVPAVIKEYNIEPTGKKWESILRKLKYHAEPAKIRLSRDEETDLVIDCLYKDKDGASIPFEFTLKRSDIEKLMEPFIERSIRKCKAVLEEARLASPDIEKLILVGGPTFTPFFRQMLTEKLRIPLEFREDPLTVVACGAAIFAGTQLIPEKSKRSVSLTAGQLKLELDYQPIGDETEPAIGGKVIATEEQTLQGYTIEFVESKTYWSSGKIDLNANGTFTATVHAERDRMNEFLIELRDEKGNRCETKPDRFTYTIGITVSAQTLANNIGVALASGKMQNFFEKNKILPAKKRLTDFQTTEEVRSGDSGTYLKIPVVEGNNKRADRNHLIGYLEISGQSEKVTRDVPIGSTVEVTLEMDESRITRVHAYIPILDEDFECTFYPQFSTIDKEDEKNNAEKAKSRLEDVREKLDQIDSTNGENLLQQIDDDRLVDGINNSVIAINQNDQDAVSRCQDLRIELDVKLDEIEELITWPALVLEAETTLSSGREIVTEHGDSQDKNDFSRLEEDIEKAIVSKNPDVLQQKVRSLSQLVMEILVKLPGFWVAQLELLTNEHKVNMRDQVQAELFIAQGNRAKYDEDVESLKLAVRQLYELLPPEVAEDLHGYKSTITKEGF